MSEKTTTDALFGGDLRIKQPASGYRFSIDSLLLADFITLKPNSSAIELGSGCGVISLILARRYDPVNIMGIEIQEELHKLSVENAELNDLSDNLQFIRGDIREVDQHFKPEAFDACISNPPYRETGSGRVPPDEGRARARHELDLTLKDLVSTGRYLLKGGGRFFIIYNCRRLGELIHTLKVNDFALKRLRLVHPYEGKDGDFILVDAVKGGGVECEVLPPLIIWREVGEYTDEVSRIIEGG